MVIEVFLPQVVGTLKPSINSSRPVLLPVLLLVLPPVTLPVSPRLAPCLTPCLAPLTPCSLMVVGTLNSSILVGTLKPRQGVKVSLGGSLRGNRSVLLGCFLGGFQHPLYEGISRLGYFQLSTLIWLGGIS